MQIVHTIMIGCQRNLYLFIEQDTILGQQPMSQPQPGHEQGQANDDLTLLRLRGPKVSSHSLAVQFEVP